jgi:isoleucyl-tRNA synthetase
MDYKPTLCLPKTEFPMKADLANREPAVREKWKALDLYRAGRRRARESGAPPFVFHDGPPYANGKFHIGNSLNRILKDFVTRYHHMKGEYVPWIPGWDCHGLPIETGVLKAAGPEARGLGAAEIRRRCTESARHWQGVQRDQLVGLGCEGDFERPYLTMDRSYEAGVVDVFESLLRKGYIARDRRVVSWCPNCATALAEAELEYAEKESPSVFVRCPVAAPSAALARLAGGGVDLLVWTTTPWTLPANLAVAVHPSLEYTVFAHGDGASERRGVVATARLEAVAGACGLGAVRALGTLRGADLLGTTYRHPLLAVLPAFAPARPAGAPSPAAQPVLPADYVSADDGTGLVHTAPGHGVDDARTGQAHGLPLYAPLRDDGRYEDGVDPALAGKRAADEANATVLGLLRGSSALAGEAKVRHSYAHCWRCKKPVLYRATEQWFVRVDHDGLRERALDRIENRVRWIPAWGSRRIGGMVRTRPDWCISRQRTWGIPIPALRCGACGNGWTTEGVVAEAKRAIGENGSDAWFDGRMDGLAAGAACPRCGKAEAALARDIFDVWFESGSSWNAVVRTREEFRGADGKPLPVDAVLEGTDQHRGWFQLSLLPSVAITGEAPWRAVVTHGFTVDEGGDKISKSKGGLLHADEIAKQFGADVARLWAASVEYGGDVPASPDLLKRQSEPYRRLRNTLRWILGVLDGFDPARDAVPEERMLLLDRWVLARLREVQATATQAFDAYEFARATRTVFEFCDGDLSAFHFDASKDRFYCEAPAGLARRSGQTALHAVASSLCRLLAPVLAHTTDEAHAYLPGPKEASVHLERWPSEGPRPGDAEVLALVAEVRAVRALVAAACEPLRATKTIGANAEASVTVAPADAACAAALASLGEAALAETFLVSTVRLLPAAPAAGGARASETAERSSHGKCARCWNLRPGVGADARFPDACARCAAVVAALPAGGAS